MDEGRGFRLSELGKNKVEEIFNLLHLIQCGEQQSIS